MIGPVALGDPAARDPAAVGSKAALLATAAEAGLPVLPGWVLPLEDSAPAIAAGAEILATEGRAKAYLAASRISLSDHAICALASVGSALVVRSSTTLDVDGRWSGSFASYLDVGADELAAAVRGCWASAFTRDALERCNATDTDPAALQIGVLVQPWVSFSFGGTAHTSGAAEDPTMVTIAPGGAHRVVAGADARTVKVDPRGVVEGDGEGHVPEGVAVDVARLAQRAVEVTGIGTIEWGATKDRVVLLQVGPVQSVTRAEPSLRPTGSMMPAATARIASIVARFRGALADALVLPWAFGLHTDFEAPALAVDEPAGALAELLQLSDLLTAAAWARDAREGRRIADDVARRLRGGGAEEALVATSGMRTPDPAAARRLVGLIDGLGAALEARGVLPAAEIVWQLTPAALEAAVGGAAPRPKGGPDRWEPFLVEVAFTHGRSVAGTPIADGVGAGRLHVVTALRDIGRPTPRAVLAAPAPLPQLAPLLWHCAGFVAPGGSAGAHLFEVAHSLGVPAVIGVALDALGPPGSPVAVDGGAGLVASLGWSSTPARRPA